MSKRIAQSRTFIIDLVLNEELEEWLSELYIKSIKDQFRYNTERRRAKRNQRHKHTIITKGVI